MSGRGRLSVIAAGAALLLLVAGGAFVVSRATGEGEATASAATMPGGGTSGSASPERAASGTASPDGAASGSAGAVSSGAASTGAASGVAATASNGGTPAVAPGTVLVEAVNLDPPVTVQVLSAKRVTPDTVRVELALVNTSASPEALDLARLTVTPAAAASHGTASKGAASNGGARTAPFSLTDLCLLTTDGSRRLFALRDDQNKPVGAGDFAPLGPNERRVIWAVFPAPPAADTQATLMVGAVTLRNVPIS